MYKDSAVCANGAMYRKDVRGFLPELMKRSIKIEPYTRKKCWRQNNGKRKKQRHLREIAM